MKLRTGHSDWDFERWNIATAVKVIQPEFRGYIK
jgi:hypothetical protein